MSDKIKIKQGQLLSVNEQGIIILNPNLNSLINGAYKSAQLKYDAGIKLGRAVDKALKDIQDQRIELCEKYAEETEYTDKNGEKQKTKYIIGKNDKGEDVPKAVYNLDKNRAQFDKAYNETMDVEVELNAYPIKLSRLMQEDCTNVFFTGLDEFIKYDLEEKE